MSVVDGQVAARIVLGIGLAILLYGVVGYLGKRSMRGTPLEEELRRARETRWYGLRWHGPEARDLMKFPVVVAKRARMMCVLGTVVVVVGVIALAVA